MSVSKFLIKLLTFIIFVFIFIDKGFDFSGAAGHDKIVTDNLIDRFKKALDPIGFISRLGGFHHNVTYNIDDTKKKSFGSVRLTINPEDSSIKSNYFMEDEL